MDFVTRKETANYVVELTFVSESSKIVCAVFNKADSSLVFLQNFDCKAHDFAEMIFKKKHLSALLRNDLSNNLCWVESKYVVNKCGSRLKVEFYLKSRKNGKILLTHDYKVRFNDLLDDIVVSAEEKWFQEACV